MKQLSLNFTCAAGANTFMIPVFDKCRLLRCKTAVSAAPGTNKTVDIKKVGGNTILSGSLNASAKGVSDLVLTAVADDKKQIVDVATPAEVTITVTNACNVTLVLSMDDHLIRNEG